MKINYKKFSGILLFLLCLSWAFMVKHDVSQIFLAVSSLIFACGTVCFVFEGRISRAIFFIIFAVILCQTSVTAKKAMVDQVFREQLKQDSAGVFFGDVAHGFKRIVKAGANDKSDDKDKRTFIERANARYLTMAILGPIMIGFLIFKKPT